MTCIAQVLVARQMAPTQFRGQQYSKLAKQCQNDQKKFVDPEFTPDTASLFFDDTTKHDIVWKRPCDLVTDPHLFIDGADVNDITQGDLGNCWFVAACSALTHNKKLLDKVIPDRRSQDWQRDKFDAGIFHFQLWRYGQWLDIVIDDFLPTRNGQLIYGRSKTNNEFWSALLEKAFAKMYGCYEALTGGQLSNALVEVSGGVPENIDLSGKSEYSRDAHERVNLFYDIKEHWNNKALLVAAIKANGIEEIEAPLDCGLLRGHAYAISNVHQIELDNKQRSLFEMFSNYEKIRMVRLHNPWGEKEWNGAWSDGSPEWTKVTDSQKKDLGITVEEDGDFWMTWDDFCHYFTTVAVCHVNTTGFFQARRFYESKFFGSWKRSPKAGNLNDRAGGCLNNQGTFLCNPQYLFDVPEDGVQVNMSLSQKDFSDNIKPIADMKGDKKNGGARNKRASYLTIGMHVMKVEENRKYRVHQIMHPIATSQYSPTRSVFVKGKNLRKGRYVIVPTTFDTGFQGDFMLRVHSSEQVDVRELKEHKPNDGLCSCCTRSICCVTRVKLIEAENLEDRKGNRAKDPYCIIKCEGHKVQTHYISGTHSPKFDLEYIFYRRKIEQPIEIEIWDSNYGRDSFLGRVSQPAPIDNENRRIRCSLKGQKENDDPMAGTLDIELASYDDPVYL